MMKIPLLGIFMLEDRVDLFLMFLDLLFFDLGDCRVIDWLVLLIEDLINKFLSFFLYRKMMRLIISEQFLLVLLKLKDIHVFIYIIIHLRLVIF